MDFLELVDQFLPFFGTALGVLAFIIFYSLWVIFLLPGLWPSMIAGLLYGSISGTIVVFLAASLGAEISFFLGRNFLYEWVQKKISLFPKLKAIDKSLALEGAKFVFLTRLSPIFPFSLLNYAYGISEVKPKDFTLGLIGILPGTFLYCSLGSLAGRISFFNDILARDSTNNNSLFISSFSTIATVGVVYIFTRAARKALKEFEDSN